MRVFGKPLTNNPLSNQARIVHSAECFSLEAITHMFDKKFELQDSLPESRESAMSFADLGLSSRVLHTLHSQGYIHPTSVQIQTIPAVLRGCDLVCIAQTGTGKTASFLLPIIEILSSHANASASPARHPVRALILTPTRELANQVSENTKVYCKYALLRSTVLFGGIDIAPQITKLKLGTEIIIATPGRLLDHIHQKTLNLSQVQILVLDEADRMLDMGFLPDLQRITKILPGSYQSLMFSATFSNQIRKLASNFLRNPTTIEVESTHSIANNVTQTIYHVDLKNKADTTSFIIQKYDLKQVIVFCNTRVGASKLSCYLETKGIRSLAIHGNKTQNERMATLEAFKNGTVEVLVATDVAARGLDIVELPCVINFDLPLSPEDYVHRIGRTGRAGASGDAISLYSDQDEHLLVDIENMIKQKITRSNIFFGTNSVSNHSSNSSKNNSCYSKTPTMHNEKIDSWFHRPYKPAEQKITDKNPVRISIGKKNRVQLAALLQSFPKR